MASDMMAWILFKNMYDPNQASFERSLNVIIKHWTRSFKNCLSLK